MSRRLKSPPPADSNNTDTANNIYSLVIYQNSDFVAGLLQQLLDAGLPIQQILDSVNETINKQSVDGSGTTSGGLNLTIPGTSVGFKADASGNVAGKVGHDIRGENKYSQTFQFTQANYLHTVRQQLAARSLISEITTPDSIENLQIGSFVEFSATFEPNEVNSILDLATPSLVSAIVKHQHRKESIAKFDFDSSDHETRQGFAHKLEIEAASKAEIAAATTTAVRQDFRNDTTREYFGKIVGNESGRRVTAVTICDTEHFSGQDKDRILDGTFRVLGKVTEVSNSRYPILSRNKFLNRINKPLLDDLESILETASDGGKFNTSLKLYVSPPIVKIIPIAIYI